MASEDSKYSPEARDVIFTVPNAISALRIISIPFIAWLIAEHRMVGALILLAISSASDGADGLIARKCNQVSKIGQILDPIEEFWSTLGQPQPYRSGTWGGLGASLRKRRT